MKAERNLQFYMANLGSELSRFFSYKGKGNQDLAEECYKRAQDIIEKLIAMPEAEPREAELAIMRDVIADFHGETRRFQVEEETLKDYFLPFARRAMSV